METTNILPQIKTTAFINQDTKALVHTNVFPNLIACYVEDGENTMTYITEERLKELGLNIDELHALAIKNLAELDNTKSDMRIMDNGDGTNAISFETYDSYDASRILLLFGPLLNTFTQLLGDAFLVAIPCRDFLLAVSPVHEAKLVGYAEKLFETKENPLTKELFMFTTNKESFNN